MRLLIIRHGESEADILKVHEGRADFSLTSKGHRQALALATYLKENYKIDKIYSSTLKRAGETAQHLSAVFGIEVIEEEDLMEFDNGLLAGLPFEEAAIKYPRVENLPLDQARYGMETKLEFRNRADRILSKILKDRGEEDTVAVVSHGGMINQLYMSFLELAPDESIAFTSGDTGIHEWIIKDGTRYIKQANILDHIKGV